MDYIRTVTAGDLRRDPTITGNPLLCLIVEKFNNCSGICSSDKSTIQQKADLPRCDDSQTLPENFPGSTLLLSEFVDSFTMLATDILMRSLQTIFEQTVQSNPNARDDELVSISLKHTRGSIAKNSKIAKTSLQRGQPVPGVSRKPTGASSRVPHPSGEC